MDNITKFMQWSVGLLITLAIISTGLLLWNKAKPIGAAAQQQAAEQARLMSEAQFSPYDSQLVSGSELVTAYRRYYMMLGFHLYVKTNKASFGMTPSASGGGGSTSCPSFNYTTGQLSGGTASCNRTETHVTDNAASNLYYVPPQARFLATVVKDANDRVAGIYFKMQ